MTFTSAQIVAVERAISRYLGQRNRPTTQVVPVAPGVDELRLVQSDGAYTVLRTYVDEEPFDD